MSGTLTLLHLPPRPHCPASRPLDLPPPWAAPRAGMRCLAGGQGTTSGGWGRLDTLQGMTDGPQEQEMTDGQLVKTDQMCCLLNHLAAQEKVDRNLFLAGSRITSGEVLIEREHRKMAESSCMNNPIQIRSHFLLLQKQRSEASHCRSHQNDFSLTLTNEMTNMKSALASQIAAFWNV